MLFITEPRACDRCNVEYNSSGMEGSKLGNRIIMLCPSCTKGLREIVWEYVDKSMQTSFSVNITSTEQDFHAHGVDVTEKEEKKMTCARKEVFDIMKDGEWHTIDEILSKMKRLSVPQSIGTYLRSFREKCYGGYIVDDRKRAGTRIFEYRLLPPS